MSSQYPPNPQNPQNPQQPQYPQYPHYPHYPPSQYPLEPPGQRTYQTVPLAPGQGYPPPYPQQPPQQKKPVSGWKIAGIGCLAFVVLCLCAGFVNGLILAARTPARAVSTDTPLPTDTAAPPTATIDPQVAVKNYLDVIHTNSATLVPDFDAVTKNCNNMVTADDVANCRAALETAQTDAGIYLNRLSDTYVPPCLSAADTKLSLSLSQATTATSEMIAGIDDTDANEVIQGAHDLNSATTTLGQANTLIKQAKCP